MPARRLERRARTDLRQLGRSSLHSWAAKLSSALGRDTLEVTTFEVIVVVLIVAVVAWRIRRARGDSAEATYDEEPSRRWGSYQAKWDAQDQEGPPPPVRDDSQNEWNDSEIDWSKRNPKRIRWHVHKGHGRNSTTSEVSRQVVPQESVRNQPYNKRTWRR